MIFQANYFSISFDQINAQTVVSSFDGVEGNSINDRQCMNAIPIAKDV